MPANLVTYNSQYYAGTLGSGLIITKEMDIWFENSACMVDS